MEMMKIMVPMECLYINIKNNKENKEMVVELFQWMEKPKTRFVSTLHEI